MNRLLDTAATAAGAIGLLVCLISGLLRLSGMWSANGFDLMTLFTVGIGLIAAACFLKLQNTRGSNQP